MAQYRLSVYVAKWSDNRNGVAMAAYRAAEKLPDHKTGDVVDFSRKGGVTFSQIIAPEDAPDWAHNRAELWNRSEAAHRRGDAVIAREIQLSLPHELSDGQRQELTTQFARFLADKYGVAVDTCIHAPNTQGDERNHHAHLLVCTRGFDASKAQGLGNNVRAFDAVSHQKAGTENHVELWRETWARCMNDAMERAGVKTEDGVSVTVDHRSYERQGKEQEPTIKEGTAATAKKRRGEETERATQNEEIRERNAQRDQLAQEIKADAQELDVLIRRHAELMTAREVEAAITPRRATTTKSNEVQVLAARRAQQLTATEAQRVLSRAAANDNAPPDNAMLPEDTTRPPLKLNRRPSESDEEYQARVERAQKRADAVPPSEPKPKFKGPSLG